MKEQSTSISLLDSLLNYADTLQEKLVLVRRDLHRHPELLYETDRTATIVANLLESWGIEVTHNVGPHFGKGVVGTLFGGAGNGPTILFRADMDALPIEEMNELDYRSHYKGIMHACGHDAHTAMLLGLAETLAVHREQLIGEFRFIFQPAEEGAQPSPLDGRLLSGGRDMIEAGILEGVERCYALHVWPELEVGALGIHPHYAMAASSHFQVKFCGRGGHHSTPHLAVDAIQMTGSYISAINGMMTYGIDPTESAVLAFGTIHAGTVINAIAEQSIITGTFRAFSKKTVLAITEGLEQHAKVIANAYGGTYELALREGIAVVNDAEAVKGVLQAGSAIFGNEQVHIVNHPSLAGDDFGWYLDRVPGAFILIGCRNTQLAITEGLHKSRFNLDEALLTQGVKLLAYLAIAELKGKEVIL